MFVENIRECKTELSRTNVLGVALLTAASLVHAIKHETAFDGYPAPRHGSFIVSANHVSTHDALKGHLWAVRSGRLLRVVVKQSLIKKGATESAEYLAGLGTTIEEATAEYNPLVAFCLRSMDVAGTRRDRKIDRALYAGKKLIKHMDDPLLYSFRGIDMQIAHCLIFRQVPPCLQ